MQIALIHDWLRQTIGGSEHVLLELANIFPSAPIYTLLFEKTAYRGKLDKERVITSGLDNLPSFLKQRPKILLPLIPRAIEQFDLSGFDIVISSSNAFAKGIITKPETRHICYCHTPARFAWDYTNQYLQEQKLNPLTKYIATKTLNRFRTWDYLSAQRVDEWLANSKHTAKRIQKYYKATAQVIYPPVSTSLFTPIRYSAKHNYYLILSTLTPYKKIDLAIKAFNKNRQPLIIAGAGSDKKRLESIARPNIKFTGWVSDQVKVKLLAYARALVFPSEEDFGITPVEAMSSGTPVIAYRKGGLLETVIPNKTGVFFDTQTTKDLNNAIQHAATVKWSTVTLAKHAKQFDRSRFIEQIRQVVKNESN